VALLRRVGDPPDPSGRIGAGRDIHDGDPAVVVDVAAPATAAN
jgi:hypothetical protein